MSGPVSASKTKLWMEAAGTACATVVAYDALSWVRVKFVSSYGDLSESYEVIEYNDVDEGEAHVLKGIMSRGEFQVELNYNGDDTGQTAMVTAFDSLSDVNIKVTLNDDPGGASSAPTRFFFPAKVMNHTVVLGDGKRVVGSKFTMRINGKIMKGARTP